MIDCPFLKRSRLVKEGTRLVWARGLRAAKFRAEFPNLLFACVWIKALSRAGLYPRCYWDDKGE